MTFLEASARRAGTLVYPATGASATASGAPGALFLSSLVCLPFRMRPSLPIIARRTQAGQLSKCRELHVSRASAPPLWVDNTSSDREISGLSRPQLDKQSGIAPCYNREFMVRFSLLVAFCVFVRSRADTALEILALRQQLAVLKRRPRPPWNGCDRLFWTTLRRLWPGGPMSSSWSNPKPSSHGTAPALALTGAGGRVRAAGGRGSPNK